MTDETIAKRFLRSKTPLGPAVPSALKFMLCLPETVEDTAKPSLQLSVAGATGPYDS